jgi:hypothetical protein
MTRSNGVQEPAPLVGCIFLLLAIVLVRYSGPVRRRRCLLLGHRSWWRRSDEWIGKATAREP